MYVVTAMQSTCSTGITLSPSSLHVVALSLLLGNHSVHLENIKNIYQKYFLQGSTNSICSWWCCTLFTFYGIKHPFNSQKNSLWELEGSMYVCCMRIQFYVCDQLLKLSLYTAWSSETSFSSMVEHKTLLNEVGFKILQLNKGTISIYFLELDELWVLTWK